MKKLSSLLLALMLLVSGVTFAQNSTPAPKKPLKAVQGPVVKDKKATAAPVKKDGTPDKRYKENKKLKKDGTPDMRYKDNKKNAAPAN